MKALLLAAAIPLVASCAVAPATGEPVEDKRYATGSNIPMRNRDVHTMTPEAFEQQRNQSAGNTGRPRGQ